LKMGLCGFPANTPDVVELLSIGTCNSGPICILRLHIFRSPTALCFCSCGVPVCVFPVYVQGSLLHCLLSPGVVSGMWSLLFSSLQLISHV
jgi:hypothetical protein